MKYLSLSISGTPIEGPGGIPQGGLEVGGAGHNLLQLTIVILFALGAIIAVIMVIISGIQWVTSGGDKQKVQAARNRLTFTIVGLVLMSLAFVVIGLVIKFLGGNTTFYGLPS